MARERVDVSLRVNTKELGRLKKEFAEFSRMGTGGREKEFANLIRQTQQATKALRGIRGGMISKNDTKQARELNKVFKGVNAELQYSIASNKELVAQERHKLAALKESYQLALKGSQQRTRDLKLERSINKEKERGLSSELKQIQAKKRAMEKTQTKEINRIDRRTGTIRDKNLEFRAQQLKEEIAATKKLNGEKKQYNDILDINIAKEKERERLLERRRKISRMLMAQELVENLDRDFATPEKKEAAQREVLATSRKDLGIRTISGLRRSAANLPNFVEGDAVNEINELDDELKELNETIKENQRLLVQRAKALGNQNMERMAINSTKAMESNLARVNEKIKADRTELAQLQLRRQEEQRSLSQSGDYNALRQREIELESRIASTLQERAGIETRLNAEQERLNRTTSIYNGRVERTGAQIEVANEATRALINTQTRQNATMDRGNALIKQMKAYIMSLGSVLAIYGFMSRIVRSAFDYVVQLNSAMVEISTVAGLNRDEIRDLSTEYNDLAKQLGRTTVEVAKSAVIFFRQGLASAEVADMVRATTIAASLAGTNLESAASKMTAALKAYKLEAVDSMQVSDKFSALAASTASSFDELSIALSKVNVNWPYLKGILSYN